jgi:hypothetical protein
LRGGSYNNNENNLRASNRNNNNPTNENNNIGVRVASSSEAMPKAGNLDWPDFAGWNQPWKAPQTVPGSGTTRMSGVPTSGPAGEE